MDSALQATVRWASACYADWGYRIWKTRKVQHMIMWITG
jgi:hypothetical protein